MHSIDAQQLKNKTSKEKTMQDRMFYNLPGLNKAFKAEFAQRNWYKKIL